MGHFWALMVLLSSFEDPLEHHLTFNLIKLFFNTTTLSHFEILLQEISLISIKNL